MSSLATAHRVLLQLRGDRRTLALLLALPCVLLALLAYVFADAPGTFNRVGPVLLAVFPLTTMFVVTSVATLRERTSGTLERLLTLPIGKLDILLGYAVAFGAVAVVQTALVSAVALGPLDLAVRGSTALVVIVALLSALLGNTLGLFTSAFAATEFQAVQFLPAFVIPQLLVCGLFVPRPLMPRPLQLVSDVLPMTYVVDAMQQAVAVGGSGREFLDLGLVAAFVLAALGLGAVTLRRRTA
ncbi:MAG: ABC transporter permease [Mycobacteriales bacterium]